MAGVGLLVTAVSLVVPIAVVLIAVLVLLGLLLLLRRRGWWRGRRAVDLVDQPPRGGIDSGAKGGGEIRFLDRRAQIIGCMRRVTGVSRLQVGRDPIAELR
jgi:hypothetical protein